MLLRDQERPPEHVRDWGGAQQRAQQRGWGMLMLTQPLLSQLQAAQARAAQLEQCPAERSIVSRQEARIRDLESQLDFQAVQMKRFEVPPAHLGSCQAASPVGEGAPGCKS